MQRAVQTTKSTCHPKRPYLSNNHYYRLAAKRNKRKEETKQRASGGCNERSEQQVNDIIYICYFVICDLLGSSIIL
jgi:hypothetical protein